MSKHLSLLTLSLSFLISGCGGGGPASANDPATQCPASWSAPPAVDPSIAIPDGESVVFHAAATGTQNYRCLGAVADGGADATFTWTLEFPAAELADCTGAKVGEHSAPNGASAPQWSNADGSVVVGHKTASFAHDASAIPWLLLSAVSHTGDGVMSRVDFVQRVNTVGGLPTEPCDVAHAGTDLAVPYTADYYFFGAAR